MNAPMVFSDSDKIADYAKDAVSAMQRMGVIGGTANSDGSYRFDPKGNATREQAAKVIAELFRKARGLNLPAPIAPPSFRVIYSGLEGAQVDGLVNSYTYDDSFTLPTPSKVGYEFLGWIGTDIGTTPVKKVTVKKGSHGDRAYMASWKMFPAQKYVITNMKHILLTDNSGSLPSSGHLVKHYDLDDTNFLRIIDEETDGSITLFRYCVNGDRVTALTLYLTEEGSEFAYEYVDYMNVGNSTNIQINGEAFGGRFSYEVMGGTEAGNSTLESQHVERVGNYLSDIYDLLDAYCTANIPGYGAGTFGLSHT